jgi:hypothetical protein
MISQRDGYHHGAHSFLTYWQTPGVKNHPAVQPRTLLVGVLFYWHAGKWHSTGEHSPKW